MLARFILWLIRIFPWLSYDYRHRRIKKRQICPACGNHGKVSTRFDPAEKKMVCQCPTCLACWGFEPVVRCDQWAKLPRVEE
jgi:hypothetical protein